MGRRRPEVGRLRLVAAELRRLTGDDAREAIAREGQGPPTRWRLETRRQSGYWPWSSRPLSEARSRDPHRARLSAGFSAIALVVPRADSARGRAETVCGDRLQHDR